MKRLIVSLALLLGLSVTAQAQTAARSPAAAPAPATAPAAVAPDLDHLAQVLRDPVRRAELMKLIDALAAAERAMRPGTTRQGTVPAAAPAPAPVAPLPAQDAAPATAEAAPEASATALASSASLSRKLMASLGEQMQGVSDLAMVALEETADLPALWSAAMALWDEPMERERILDALLYLLLVGGVGLAAERLVALLLRRPARRLDRMAPSDGDVWTWLRRVPLVVGRFGLDVLPLLAITLTVSMMLSVVRPWFTSRLVLLMVLHLYVVARLAVAVVRMLLSPTSGHLRLIPVSDETATYLFLWLRRMMLVGLGGYALADASLVIGVPETLHNVVFRIALLVITVMLIQMIRQKRDRVAAVLRPPPLDAEDLAENGVDGTRRVLRAARARLAETWHLLAVLWLVASWVVWAVGVDRGFTRLLHGTALSLGLFVIAKLLDEGVRWLLHQLRHPPAELARSAPWLKRLGLTYGGPLRLAWTLVLLATCAVLLTEIWGYGTLAWFQPNQPGHRLLGGLLSIGFTTVLGLVVWEIANAAIERSLTRHTSPDSKAGSSTRLRTLLPVLRAFIAVGVCAFILFDALQQLGVNIGPLVAGAGVIGLALGVGSQKLVQDVITGIFLLFEDSVAIGDVVTLGGQSGVVEHLTIRSIKLRATDGSVSWVPFSAVSTVTNMTRDFGFAVVDVTVDWGSDPDRVTQILRELGAEMRADERWHDMLLADPEVVGVEKLTDRGLVFRMRLKTIPAARWSVTRELNRRIRLHFAEAGIETPLAPPTRSVEPVPVPAPAPVPVRAGVG